MEEMEKEAQTEQKDTTIIERIDKEIADLTKKVSQASYSIHQAEKQYENSLAKIEEQKKKAEITKEHIFLVKIKTSNRLMRLQDLHKFRAEILNKGILGA